MRTEANGIAINYDIAGPERGPAVVMSHSLGCNLTMWDAQLAVLSQRCRVVRFDTRGHGLSAAPSGPYTLDQLGDDALALMDALGLGRVHWVGLSMGGMIGQNIALRRPERLASLALCDTMAAVPAAAAPVWAQRIATAESQGMQALVDATMQRWFTAAYLDRNPPDLGGIRMAFVHTPPQGFVGCCHAIRVLDYLERLREVRMPTLVIVGAEDAGTPVALSEAMHARLPDSRLVVLDHASHLANVEQPEAFTNALLSFLEAQAD